jgi:undecaprenol kinase/diacylglycerol kinase (ATP)
MNQHPKKFSASFGYAFRGIIDAFRTEKHMKVHLVAALVAIISLFIFKQSKVEVLFVCLAIALVWITEIINTAIEKTVDLAMPDQHPLAKLAKDLAAGAVLVASAFALVVGIIVFVG